jgi:hypothetical protein
MSTQIDFTDKKHSVAELAFQGATEMDLEDNCGPETLDMLAAWRERKNHQASGIELFRMEHCPAFSISYEGKAGEYWPDESANDIVETLIRDFYYRSGICNLSDERVRLVHLKYNIMALAGDEFVLVCPYLTEVGNISGICVVCVTKMLQ